MRDGRFYKFWAYIVCSPSGTLYVGLTGRINVRIKQHKTETLEGFTKKYGCKRLVYYESYDSFYTAERREKQLKGWRRAKKIALIEKVNPRWQDLAEHWGWTMLFRGQSLVETPESACLCALPRDASTHPHSPASQDRPALAQHDGLASRAHALPTINAPYPAHKKLSFPLAPVHQLSS